MARLLSADSCRHRPVACRSRTRRAGVLSKRGRSVKTDRWIVYDCHTRAWCAFCAARHSMTSDLAQSRATNERDSGRSCPSIHLLRALLAEVGRGGRNRTAAARHPKASCLCRCKAPAPLGARLTVSARQVTLQCHSPGPCSTPLAHCSPSGRYNTYHLCPHRYTESTARPCPVHTGQLTCLALHPSKAPGPLQLGKSAHWRPLASRSGTHLPAPPAEGPRSA